MEAYVIIAEVTVPAERLDEFLTHSLDDARNSVATEPGCRQFDLNVSADGSPTVVFYEVYDDRAAFEAHLQTPHFFRWNATPRKASSLRPGSSTCTAINLRSAAKRAFDCGVQTTNEPKGRNVTW